jgi:hypothetical protein
MRIHRVGLLELRARCPELLAGTTSFAPTPNILSDESTPRCKFPIVLNCGTTSDTPPFLQRQSVIRAAPIKHNGRAKFTDQT